MTTFGLASRRYVQRRNTALNEYSRSGSCFGLSRNSPAMHEERAGPVEQMAKTPCNIFHEKAVPRNINFRVFFSRRQSFALEASIQLFNVGVFVVLFSTLRGGFVSRLLPRDNGFIASTATFSLVFFHHRIRQAHPEHPPERVLQVPRPQREGARAAPHAQQVTRSFSNCGAEGGGFYPISVYKHVPFHKRSSLFCDVVVAGAARSCFLSATLECFGC